MMIMPVKEGTENGEETFFIMDELFYYQFAMNENSLSLYDVSYLQAALKYDSAKNKHEKQLKKCAFVLIFFFFSGSFSLTFVVS